MKGLEYSSLHGIIKIVVILFLLTGIMGLGWWGSTVFAQGENHAGSTAQTESESATQSSSAAGGVSATVLPGHWLTFTGAAFSPADSSMKYTVTSTGCLKPTTDGLWYMSINLPDHTEIEYLAIGYNNAMASQASTLWLMRYAKDGGSIDLASITAKPGNVTGPGYFSDISSELADIEVVDNYTYAYSYVWEGSTSQQLCSARMGYVPPSIFGEALPIVINHS